MIGEAPKPCGIGGMKYGDTAGVDATATFDVGSAITGDENPITLLLFEFDTTALDKLLVSLFGIATIEDDEELFTTGAKVA